MSAHALYFYQKFNLNNCIEEIEKGRPLNGVSCFAGRKSGCAWPLHSSRHQKLIFSLRFLFL